MTDPASPQQQAVQDEVDNYPIEIVCGMKRGNRPIMALQLQPLLGRDIVRLRVVTQGKTLLEFEFYLYRLEKAVARLRQWTEELPS